MHGCLINSCAHHSQDNQEAGMESIESKKHDLEAVSNPIMERIHGSSGSDDSYDNFDHDEL